MRSNMFLVLIAAAMSACATTGRVGALPPQYRQLLPVLLLSASPSAEKTAAMAAWFGEPGLQVCGACERREGFPVSRGFVSLLRNDSSDADLLVLRHYGMDGDGGRAVGHARVMLGAQGMALGVVEHDVYVRSISFTYQGVRHGVPITGRFVVLRPDIRDGRTITVIAESPARHGASTARVFTRAVETVQLGF